MFVRKAEKELTRDMKRGIISGITLMADASQSIFGWCRSMQPLLKAPAVEKSTADLMKILADGNGKINLAQIELRMSLLMFNTITVKFIVLQQQFENELQKESDETKSSQTADFKEKLKSTQEFYKNLKAKADEMFSDIIELKAQIDKIEANVATDEGSKQGGELTESLIVKCNEIINE